MDPHQQKRPALQMEILATAIFTVEYLMRLGFAKEVARRRKNTREYFERRLRFLSPEPSLGCDVDGSNLASLHLFDRMWIEGAS